MKRGDLKWWRCPSMKIYCALCGRSSAGRYWCGNDTNDPCDYELCPIPKQRVKANKEFKQQNRMCACGHIDTEEWFKGSCLLCKHKDQSIIVWAQTDDKLKIDNLLIQKEER